jgi:hypothetical protein
MKHSLFVVAVCMALSACSKPQPEVRATPASAAAAKPAAESVPAAAPAPAAPVAFSQTYEMQGLTFKVVADAGTLTVTPSGLQAVNEPMTRSIKGRVTRAEVADIDVDGSPEIYVFLSADDGGGLVGYAANKRKSLSEIYLRPITDDAKNRIGYQGHDEFAVLENRIGQRFPVNGADGKPTGKMRQLQYRLAPGEAGWQLVVDRVTEF